MLAYLDAASTTPVRKEVLKSMLPFFSQSFGNPGSSHAMGDVAYNAIESSRELLAKKLHASADQIIFTSGGTEANNLVLHQVESVAFSAIEHSSVIIPALKKDYMQIPVDAEGVVREGLDVRKMDLVSVMSINNETGIIQNVKEWCDIAHEASALFHADHVQGFCKVPFDVKKIPVDFLSISAHKVHGPKGVGAVYAKDPEKIISLIDGSQKGRAGTLPVAEIVGFAKAAQIYTPPKTNVIKAFNKIIQLGEINGSAKRYEALANVCFENVSALDMIQHLSHKNVFVSASAACSAHSKKYSHVLEAMHVPESKMKSSLRVSVHSLTTLKEMQYAKEQFEKILKSLRAL